MDDKIGKLLAKASDPRTTDGERLGAMNIFYALAEQAGGIPILLGRSAPAPKFVPYSQQRAERLILEDDLRKAQARIAELEKENIRLRARVVRPTSPRTRRKLAEDGTMSYLDFSREVMRRFVNADRRWQMEFQEQTGLPRGRFPRFMASGRVDDPAFIAALPKLRQVEPPRRQSEEWTLEEVARVRHLSENHDMTEKNIANCLANEFGRRVTENMLKRLKDNSRKRTGVFRDPSFGPPIGRTRSQMNEA